MKLWVVSILAAVAVAAACGGDDGDDGSSSASPASKQAPSPYGLAPTSLTPLADKMADIAFAALRGQPLPQNGIPVQPLAPGQILARQDPEGPMPVEGVAVFGFFVEAELVLRPGGGAYPPGGLGSGGLYGAGDGTIRTAFFVDRAGMSVVEVAVREPREARPLAPALAGVGQAGIELLTALRDGSATQMLLDEADRIAVGNDAFYQEIASDRPSLTNLERAKTLAMSVPQPLGYRVDDAGVLARSQDGRVWMMAMEFEQDMSGAVALEASPLVRIRHFRGRF